MVKRKRRVHSIKNELIKKSQESALAAIQIFNNPLITFKSESFIVLMNIAWTYLLHAYYRKIEVDYRYFDQKEKIKKYRKTKGGADKYWELEKCLRHEKCNIGEPIKDNLRFLIGIRHEIEHKMTDRIDNIIIGKFQACCINYNVTIKQLFGEGAGLDKTISLALQLFSFGEQQIDQLKNEPSLPKNVIKFISDHEKNMESTDDARYDYKVIYIRINANHENQADTAYKFVSEESPECKNIRNVLVKDREKQKWSATPIVDKGKKVYPEFSIHKHTALWQRNDAKNPSKKYGVMVVKTWYWYDEWLKFVLDHCKKECSKK
jgi:hypothetical protein